MTRVKQQIRRKTVEQHAAALEQIINMLHTADYRAIQKVFTINSESLPNEALSIKDFVSLLDEFQNLFVSGIKQIDSIKETIEEFDLTSLVYTPVEITPTVVPVATAMTVTLTDEDEDPEELPL